MLKLTAAGGALLGQAGAGNKGDSRTAAPGAGFELADATVAGLSAAMQSGARTSVSIAQLYLARIDGSIAAGPRSTP